MKHQPPSNGLQRSLACLASPAALLAIALLLLNDHLFKVTIPSWWTGKLSDFAGLFFFPFVLTALLSLLLDRFHQPAARTATLAFTLTALWFTLIKTVPPITTLTETAWATLISAPVQIIPDPTDLIALVVLLPAWKQWQRPPQQTRHPHPLIGWAALGLASLASLATSCEEIPLINRFVVVDNLLYALGDGYNDSVVQYNQAIEDWVRVAEPSPALLEQLTTPPSLPVTACVPDQPQLCYQITGDEKVYSSTDGGQTWQVAWELPLGRRYFLDRYLTQSLLPSCKGSLQMGPYDLVVLPTDGNHIVIVAMGNEGILLRNRTGEWLRQSLLGATPTPLSTPNLTLIPFMFSQEETSLFIVTLLTLVGLVILARQLLWPYVLPILAFFLIGVPLAIFLGIATDSLFICLSIFGAALILLAFVRRKNPPPNPLTNYAIWLWLCTAVAIMFLGSLPFIFWMSGLIPVYQWALAASIVFVLAIIGLAGRYFFHLSKTAT